MKDDQNMDSRELFDKFVKGKSPLQRKSKRKDIAGFSDDFYDMLAKQMPAGWTDDDVYDAISQAMDSVGNEKMFLGKDLPKTVGQMSKIVQTAIRQAMNEKAVMCVVDVMLDDDLTGDGPIGTYALKSADVSDGVCEIELEKKDIASFPGSSFVEFAKLLVGKRPDMPIGFRFDGKEYEPDGMGIETKTEKDGAVLAILRVSLERRG